MNISDVRTQHTEHGHVGEFRLDWRSEFFQVRENDGRGQVVYFPSKEKAELAAWREMHRIEKTAMVRGGDKLQAHPAADAHFKLKPFIRQRGKTRLAEVVRKGGAA